MSYICAWCDEEFSDDVMCPECVHGRDAEVIRLKAELATARDSLQHQSEAAAQGWERAAKAEAQVEELERLLDLANGGLAERDSLRAHVAKLQLDVSGLKGTIRENYDAHVLVQAERDSLRSQLEATQRLYERERGEVAKAQEVLRSLRSQRDAARKELGDVLENLDLKSLNSALDEVRAQASEFSLALALEKVARAKAELERDALAEALETLRLVVGPESEDEMYGAFHGGDPRDFTPDPECSTEAERSAHAVACKKAEESGAARLLPDTHSFERLGEDAAVHIARAGFGLGTTVFRNEALCEAMDIIGAALLRVKP